MCHIQATEARLWAVSGPGSCAGPSPPARGFPALPPPCLSLYCSPPARSTSSPTTLPPSPPCPSRPIKSGPRPSAGRVHGASLHAGVARTQCPAHRLTHDDRLRGAPSSIELRAAVSLRRPSQRLDLRRHVFDAGGCVRGPRQLRGGHRPVTD